MAEFHHEDESKQGLFPALHFNPPPYGNPPHEWARTVITKDNAEYVFGSQKTEDEEGGEDVNRVLV